MNTHGDKRAASRLENQSTQFPFLGFLLPSHDMFEYLVMNASPGGLRFAIPEWCQKPAEFKEKDLIYFNLPVTIRGRRRSLGEIVWTGDDEETGSPIFGARFLPDGTAGGPEALVLEDEETAFEYSRSVREPHRLLNVFNHLLLTKGRLLHTARAIDLDGLCYGDPVPGMADFAAQLATERAELDTIFAQMRRAVTTESDPSTCLLVSEILTLIETALPASSVADLVDTAEGEVVIDRIRQIHRDLTTTYNAVVLDYTGQVSCDISASPSSFGGVQ